MQDSNGCIQNGTPSSSNSIATENGHLDISNGSGSGDGVQLDRTKQEIVRLIGQYLKNEGLTRTAELLISESGCRLDHPAAVKFKHHILDGDWSKAYHDLQELQPLISSSQSMVEMKFSILEQKYLEFLEDGKVLDALNVLRNELTPLQHNTSRVHQLSSYMMCSNAQELMERANWEGKGLESRTTLMNKLQTFLPPSVMLPPHRLNALLSQALEYQTIQCSYHNTSQGIALQTASLLTDHICPKDDFPTHTIQIWNSQEKRARECVLRLLQAAIVFEIPLVDNEFCPPCTSDCVSTLALAFRMCRLAHRTYRPVSRERLRVLNDHCDEVWYCQFSPDGTKLATGSKDNNVIIWDVHPETCTLSVKKILEGHNYGVAYISWCPDNVHLIACGPEESAEVWLWNIENEKLLKICQSQEDALTCCSWHKSGKKFVVGGIRGHFYQCDMEGNILENWDGVRVNGLYCRKDGKTVLASDTHHRIRSYVFEESQDADVLHEDRAIISFTVDRNDRLCLLNILTQGIHLWDLNYKCLIKKYRGVSQGHFNIHSTFGGVNQDFIASGSEDSMVYIWHIKNEDPIATLKGHTRSVNAVAWNPVFHHIMVSVSDDFTVRVWGPKKMVPKQTVSSSNNDSTNNGTWTDTVS